MTIEELQTILAFSTTDKKKKVYVNAKYGDGTLERCDIRSFATYSDAIVLNTETEYGAVSGWRPTEEQVDTLVKLEEAHVMEHERNKENAHMYMVLKSLKEELIQLRKK